MCASPLGGEPPAGKKQTKESITHVVVGPPGSCASPLGGLTSSWQILEQGSYHPRGSGRTSGFVGASPLGGEPPAGKIPFLRAQD